jgi:hypothetical protein
MVISKGETQKKAWITIKKNRVLKCLEKCKNRLKRDFKNNPYMILSERDVEFYLFSYLNKYKFNNWIVNSEIGLINRKNERNFPDLIVTERDNIKSLKIGCINFKDFRKVFCIQIKLAKGNHIPHSDLERDWKKAKGLGLKENNIFIFLVRLINISESDKETSEYIKEQTYYLPNRNKNQLLFTNLIK